MNPHSQARPCPATLQGTTDDVIEVAHGQQLHALARRPSTPLWPQGYGHQDVEASPGAHPPTQGVPCSGVHRRMKGS